MSIELYNEVEQAAHIEWLRVKKHAMTLAKVADGSIKPPPPLFDGLLLHRTLTMISAEPFSGKTMLMLAMAMSLASGVPLLGRYKPTEQRRVLFIGQDAPTWDYVRQVQKLLRGYGLGPKEVAAMDTELILNEGVFITDPGFLEWLGLWHEAVGFEVLMLDSFINVHRANENDNQQMATVMHVLKTIRDKYGCAILFSHHTTKPSGDSEVSANYRARGATAIAASVDFHFQLSRRGPTVALAMPKGRGADGIAPPEHFIIEADENDAGEPTIVLSTEREDEHSLGLSTYLSEPRKRGDVIRWYQSIAPTAENPEIWVDNALQKLKRKNAIKKVSYGTWQAC